ncbi:hypothetical protein B005_0005 [Nocardiopsis alba ATCC BAA-2165]|uniref:Uncharacterized protein n=1 Tax=Nocardiopsis alba (strain ATCC BAA-2165 / BE74) TaxID=1205910 RepID=J7L4X1_NOCAA|nr:hypothetical protein B005_0005 [Nocardiopsis alba ATCC BAA-2165]
MQGTPTSVLPHRAGDDQALQGWTITGAARNATEGRVRLIGAAKAEVRGRSGRYGSV